MNKTEAKVMQGMTPAFRLAWVNGLAADNSKSSVPGLADMFQFPDCVEVAFAKLNGKLDKYPREIARQVALFLARTDKQEDWDNGVLLLKRVAADVLRGVLDTIENTWCVDNPWPAHVRKLKKALK